MHEIGISRSKHRGYWKCSLKEAEKGDMRVKMYLCNG